MTTSSSRDWLHTKSGVGKEPMWPTREEIVISYSQGKKTDLEFCNEVGVPTYCEHGLVNKPAILLIKH